MGDRKVLHIWILSHIRLGGHRLRVENTYHFATIEIEMISAVEIRGADLTALFA